AAAEAVPDSGAIGSAAMLAGPGIGGALAQAGLFTPSAPAPSDSDGGPLDLLIRGAQVVANAPAAVGSFVYSGVESFASDVFNIANLGYNIQQNIAINDAKAKRLGDQNFIMNGNLQTAGPSLTESVANGLKAVAQIAVENSAFAGAGLQLAATRSARNSSTAADLDSANCFPAGTLVATQDGPRAIESIVLGEQLWAYDLVASDWRLRPVLQLYRRHHEGLAASVRVSDEVIEATFRHPFWVVRGEGLDDRPRM